MFFKTSKTKVITTTIPQQLYEEARARHWKHNDLWLLGFQIKKNNPVLDRVREIERENEELSRKLERLAKRLYSIQEATKESGLDGQK